MKQFRIFLCGIMYIIVMSGVLYSPNVLYLRIMGVLGMSAVFYNSLKEIDSK